MTYPNYFIWKSQRTDDKFIVVNTLPDIIKAAKRVNKVTITGRNGVLHETDETYDEVLKSCECTLMDDSNIDDVTSWLTGSGEVIFSNEPDKVYQATIINQIPFKYFLPSMKSFLIQFDCQPFKYSTDDLEEMVLGNTVTRAGLALDPLLWYNFTGGTAFQNNQAVKSNLYGPFVFNNPGTHESQPVITIYGSGAATVTINGVSFQITNIDSYITIDSVMGNAYKDTTNQNSLMIGELPILEPGANTISWTGNIERIEMQCNSAWR